METTNNEVDFKDIVTAETITTLSGERLQNVAQDRKGALKEFAQQLFSSLSRTQRSGEQEIAGIDLNNKDIAIRNIEREIREVVAARCHIEQDESVPEGQLKGRVSLILANSFRVRAEFGGRTFQIDIPPKSVGLQLDSTVVIKPLSDRPVRSEHDRIPAEFVSVG